MKTQPSWKMRDDFETANSFHWPFRNGHGCFEMVNAFKTASNSSALFQRMCDAVCHIMLQRNFDVINDIDDILGIDVPSKINPSYDTLHNLLEELGFEISQKKIETPTTRLNCLGIIVDTPGSSHCWEACYILANVFEPPGSFSIGYLTFYAPFTTFYAPLTTGIR